MAEERPYSRSEFNRALIANALLDPFAIVLLAVVAVAGILLGALGILLPVGLVLYGAAAARTYFDEDVANKVLERERGKRRDALESGERPGRPGHAGAADRRPARGARCSARRASARPWRAPSCPTPRCSTRWTASCGRWRARPGARSCSTTRWPRPRPPAVEERLAELDPGQRPGEGRAGGRAHQPAEGAAPDGGPAPGLLRRDGEDPDRAGHRARQPGVGVGVHRRRQPAAAGGRRARPARGGRRAGGRDERGVRAPVRRERGRRIGSRRGDRRVQAAATPTCDGLPRELLRPRLRAASVVRRIIGHRGRLPRARRPPVELAATSSRSPSSDDDASSRSACHRGARRRGRSS